MLFFSLLLCLLLFSACGGDEDNPVPTLINPNPTVTEIAQNSSPTIEPQPPIATAEPSPTAVAIDTLAPTLTPTASEIPATSTPIVTSPPVTPSPTPTHIVNPDAVVKPAGAELLSAPSVSAFSGLILPHLTSLQIQARTADNQFLQVSQMDSNQQGWIEAGDVVIFIPLDRIAIGSGIAGGSGDLSVPPEITEENAGTGFPYVAFDATTCGDNYWGGDGTTSMEVVAYEGHYPRFARPVIRLYVYYSEDVQSEAWELAIAETLAQLSQAVRIERVYPDDLALFEPAVPMEMLMVETRVDMIWHILEPGDFEAAKTCDSNLSCSQYSFDGLIKGGPLRFGGMLYVPSNAERKTPVLLHAAVHALGLWVHSPDPADLMHISSTAAVLSPRDVQTLRCLYNAPPYGDGNFLE